jgi:hypothetical protein
MVDRRDTAGTEDKAATVANHCSTRRLNNHANVRKNVVNLELHSEGVLASGSLQHAFDTRAIHLILRAGA